MDMHESVVMLELPSSLYADLEELAATKHTDIPNLLVRMVAQTREQHNDPVLELIGAYHSTCRLIDNIPVSEDPELYTTAAALGKQAHDMHAWEIAPHRYMQAPDGRPIRRTTSEDESCTFS